MKSPALVGLSLTLLAVPSPGLAQQAFQHRWGGLVFDAFQSANGQHLWTVEDGGRIRYRHLGPPATWTYQAVPDSVKDTLHRVHFLADNMTGWAVGSNGWVLKTTNGGGNWTALFQMDSYTFPGAKEDLYDVHFLEDGRGWLLGLHGLWVTLPGTSGDSPAHWTPATISGHPQLDTIELYAIDVVERDEGVLALVTAEPGYIFRSLNGVPNQFTQA
jgi:photosystem II stability/assembly factor-like uncharacterized protein